MQTITKHPTLTAEDIGNIWTGGEAWDVSWEVAGGVAEALANAVPSLHGGAVAQVKLQAVREILAQIAVQRPELEGDVLDTAARSAFGRHLRAEIESIITILRHPLTRSLA